MLSLPRRLFTELLGTFGFVFFACAAIVVNAYPGASVGLQGLALVQGLAMAVMLTATIGLSGGMLNPALTIGLLVGRRLDARTAAGLVVAQLAGAVLGALAVKLAFPAGVGRIVAYGAPLIASSVTLPQAMGIEALLTFLLMSVVFGTVSVPGSRIGGMAIGLTVFIGVMVAAPLTGPAMNPARAFGPALMAGIWTAQGVYWIGPIVGAILAALIWDRVILQPRVVTP